LLQDAVRLATSGVFAPGEPHRAAVRIELMNKLTFSMIAVWSGLAAIAAPANAKTCDVIDGVVADVTSGPFLPPSATVTLKSTYKAEFRWDIADKEAIGWMRIVDAEGAEIGWVPAGHDGIRCGGAN
jgi:hypothetical protein